MMLQPAQDLPGLALHGIGLVADDIAECAHRRRQRPLRPAPDLRHGQHQITGLVGILIDLAPLDGLGIPGEDVAAELPHGAQLRCQGLHLDVMLTAAPFLQGLDQGVHLALGLGILNREKHPGLEIHQMGCHGDKLAGHFQIQLLPLFQPAEILVADQGDGDVLDLHFVFAQQKQNKIQRAFKVLHLLRLGADHLFQFEYRVLQRRSPQKIRLRRPE